MRPILSDYSIVTVKVIYYLPDYRSLVNAFVWQTLDLRPRYPRVHRFLDFWHREIEAVIKEVTISDSVNNWRTGTFYRF